MSHDATPGDSNPTEAKSEFDAEADDRNDAIIGVALRWSLVFFVALSAIVTVVVIFLNWPDEESTIQQTELAKVEMRELSQIELPTVLFTDVTSSAGIDFVHENGAYGQKLLPETMGGGCAFWDFDGDGDQDLLFVNSRRWPSDPREDSTPDATMALYRNDGKGQFENVTDAAGLDVSLYGMGVAVGDYDADGHVDLFISAVGSNYLFHNDGKGRFTDVTQRAGVAGDADRWSSSCGWFDYDGDGDLDLFVCNYVDWSRENDEAQDFQLTGGGRAYGRPQNFAGTFPYLYRNEGTGRFTDVSADAGLQMRNPATGVPMAKSLGLALADFDQDGWMDVVVANDTVQNFFFRNRGDGSFEELGARVGVAFDMSGNSRGAMGIDVAWFRNNDAMGIAIGNFANEMTALYVAYGGQMQFMDEAVSTGLGPSSRSKLTFGICYVDVDLDGRLDLLAANGHLEKEINRVQPSQHYEQSAQLFWNCGPQNTTEFVPMPVEKCGEDLLRPMVGRGASFADIDGDGDLDVVLTAIAGPPRLLRNDQQLGHHWLRIKLVGAPSNRAAIGAWIEVDAADQHLRQQVMPTRSYLSQVELPVTFGLGDTSLVHRLRIHWPDGQVTTMTDVAVDQTLEIRHDERREK